MDENLLVKAKKLSERLYATRIQRDLLSDNSDIFVAYNPELKGCKAQGKTSDEALSNLADARFEYILSLLEDGLLVPEPLYFKTRTEPAPDIIASYEVIITIFQDDKISETVHQLNTGPVSKVPLIVQSVQV